MPEQLQKCPWCGKLFGFKTGKQYCAECLEKQMEWARRIDDALAGRWESRNAVAAHAGLTRHQVDFILDETTLSNPLDVPGEACVRCGATPRVQKSTYCYKCFTDLSGRIAHALDDLASKTGRRSRGGLTVAEEVERKRGRGAARRRRP